MFFDIIPIYESFFGLGQIKCLSADISESNTAQRIIVANDGSPVNAFVCDNVLHFLTGERLQNGVQTLQVISEPESYGYLSVCSIYNPASVGSKGNTDALEIVHAATDNGRSEKPVAFFQPEMSVPMTFFTEPSFRRILEDGGFEIITLDKGYNQRLRNGLGDKYPENFGAIVQKRNVNELTVEQTQNRMRKK